MPHGSCVRHPACLIVFGSCRAARSPCRSPTTAFDRAYSHNVLMNIADKAGVYREAFRVLKPGGRLVLCHLNAGPNGPPEFPVPWAAVPENSFLATDEETRRDLAAAGFEILTFHDTTQATMSANTAMRRKMEAEGLPPTGMHVLMGERFLQLQINSLRAMEDGRTTHRGGGGQKARLMRCRHPRASGDRAHWVSLRAVRQSAARQIPQRDRARRRYARRATPSPGCW